MMGRLERDQGQLFYSFCLEEVVPGLGAGERQRRHHGEPDLPGLYQHRDSAGGAEGGAGEKHLAAYPGQSPRRTARSLNFAEANLVRPRGTKPAAWPGRRTENGRSVARSVTRNAFVPVL
jgi:hypothetical protein